MHPAFREGFRRPPRGAALNQNLYQVVSMSAGAMVVKPGGQLLAVAECSDGFPDHGSYFEVLTSAEPGSADADGCFGGS